MVSVHFGVLHICLRSSHRGSERCAAGFLSSARSLWEASATCWAVVLLKERGDLMEMERSTGLLSIQDPVFPSICCNYSVDVPYEVQSPGLGVSTLVPFPRALSLDRGSGVRAVWVLSSATPGTWPSACLVLVDVTAVSVITGDETSPLQDSPRHCGAAGLGRAAEALPWLPSEAGPASLRAARVSSKAIEANLASLTADLVACHSHRPICTMVNKSCS